MAAGCHTWSHCKYLEMSASLHRRSHGEVEYLFTIDMWRGWRSFHGSNHCASHRHLKKKFPLMHALTLLIFALLISSVKCEDVDEELKLKYPNLHRRGLLPQLFGNKQSRRLPANPAGGVKIEDGGPHPPGKMEQNNRRPVMPPEQHKVRYDVNPWQDTQKFNYKWPENQRAYFTCPRGYFIASLEPKFGTVQSSILRVPWNNKASLFTLKDKYDRGLSPTPAHMKYPKMNAPEGAQQKQIHRIPGGQSEVSETGCDPVLHCLGHQACLFKISVELCAADPVPGNRKMFSIGVTCVKDSMEGEYISDSKDFVVARKERDHTLYFAFDSSESTPAHAYIVFHQIPEDEIFGVDCPPVNQALQSGYGGWCTLPAPSQTDIADQLWNILGRVPFPECRQELKDVYCAYHYNTTGGCLPPAFIEPRKEGEVPKLGEVNFSFNALPKRGPRPDMTKHKAMLADKHIGLIPVKLGFLILAHANAEAVAQLLEGVYRKHNFYVVHVDYRADSVRDHLIKKAEELRGDLDNIHVLPKSRSFIASWGSYDIVRAEIEGYEELLRMGIWEFLINLSGADLPLRDVDDISAMLAAYRGYNFMRQNGNWNDRSGKATDYTVWYGCGGHVYNISKRGHRPSWSDMHSASQWAVLNRDYLDYVLNPAKRDQKLNSLQFYAMTCIIPDESFLISMMKISPFRNTFIHTNMHHLKAFARRDDKGFCRHTDDIDFCGQGPGTIVAADAINLHLMAHNFFFSRKYTGDPEEKARLEALKLANGAHYEDLYKEFIKPSMLRQLVEMVMEEQYGENWMNEAEVQDILKVRVFPQPVTLDPCCLPIYTTKNQLSRDVKYWIDFSLFERATSSVRVLRGSFIPQSRTNCFSRGHLKALYISSHVTNDRKVPVKQVNILPHEVAGGKQLQMVSYVNVNENIAKAQGCNEIENLPDDSFDHRSPDSFTYVKYPKGVNNPSIHFNASLINDIGEVKCFLEVVVTFKKPHPTVQQTPPSLQSFAEGNSNANGDKEGHEKVTHETESPQLKVQDSVETEEGNSTDVHIDKRPMATVTIESNSPQLEVECSMETEATSEGSSFNVIISEKGHEAIVTNDSNSLQNEVQDSVETEDVTDESDCSSDEDKDEEIVPTANYGHSQDLESQKSKEAKVQKFKRHPWSEEEVSAVYSAFKRDVLLNRLPGKSDTESALETYPCLAHHKWTNIKDFIRNRLSAASENKTELAKTTEQETWLIAWSLSSDTVRFINTINCGPLTAGFWTIVLFQKGVKDPFPYTTQIYFAEDNGASDWDEYSLNDALYGLWLIEDVRPLPDEDYPGVAKQSRPVFHDPNSEDSAYKKAHPQPRKKPPQKVAAKEEEKESSEASSVNEESDKDTKKEEKPGGGVKNNPPNNVLFQNDNSQADSKAVFPGRNLNTPPNNKKRIKLRESLQRGLVDPLRLSENNRDDIGKRHAMGHQEGSNLGLVGDKTRAHFKGWRHQSFAVILFEFLLISTVLFIFTRLVLVPMRLVKRRSSGFRSYLTFLVSFTLLQVVVFSIFTLYSS